jgi:hypothetical protein
MFSGDDLTMMVDRVTRTIEIKSQYMISQHFAKTIARAAIGELRDPSEEQLNKWVFILENDGWDAMIDAILNEESK